MNVSFPLHFDHRGRTAESSDEQYVRDLIEAVLFTAPGERVMRPDFGCAVSQLLFAPSSPELAGSTQMLIQSALTQWLGDLITVQAIDVRADDATLRIAVSYTLRGDDTPRVARLESGGAP